jgi:hypothetical protein
MPDQIAALNRHWRIQFGPGATDKPNGVDWSWPGRIMPAKSGWREGTRPSDFGFSRQKTSNDKVSWSG